MKEKAKPVIDKYSKQLGEDLVKEMYAQVEKARGGK
jgi:TRAP-type transport system periplasmic protein